MSAASTGPVGHGGKNPLTQARWSPYAVGIGLGLLSWLAFAFANAPIGVTTSYSAMAGACAMPFVGEDAVMNNAYWAKTAPKIDYGMLFLVGTALGGAASALLSRTWRVEVVPQVWRDRFGPAPAGRLLAAFVGGVLAMYGARMAGGCTSGHGISGGLQMAVSSWVFFMTMFAVGVGTAFLMFSLGAKRKGA